MGWIRVAAFGIVVAAGIAAALLWPGDVAANAIVPLTLIATPPGLGISAMLLRCTECGERDADFVVSGDRP